MAQDRITQLRISGLRVIETLELELSGLIVLIGENGTGKSSILEALELLRQAANPVAFVTDIVEKRHGGLQSLLRRGADELRLGVTVKGAGPDLAYELSLGFVGTIPTVLSEELVFYSDPRKPGPLIALTRRGSKTTVFDPKQRKLVRSDEGEDVSIGGQDLALPKLWLKSQSQPVFGRMLDALARIEFHVPFETRPLWQQRELDVRMGPRWPSVVEKTDRLSRFATNLPNAFQELRNLGGETWTRVVERVRLGLGDDVRDFRLSPSGRGNIELELILGSDPNHPLPADALSEGQLSYLAFAALVELHSERSVLAFDEPEMHLHPALLTRVIWWLEEIAESTPVLLSTHSDRLLDILENPAQSTVLCDLDGRRAMRTRRPDAGLLASWLENYRGLGSLRADGGEPFVFQEAAEAKVGA